MPMPSAAPNSQSQPKSKSKASFSLNLGGLGKAAPARLKRKVLQKSAIGVSSDALLGNKAAGEVDYVKGMVGNKVAPVKVKKKKQLVIPLAKNPWERPQKKKRSEAEVAKIKDAKSDGSKLKHKRASTAAAVVPENETEDQRANREAAEALLKELGGDEEEEENDSFVIAMTDDMQKEGHEMSQLERVMAHKKAFEKDDETGKVLSEKEKLQKEMAMRPEANEFTSDAYEKVSIKDFGRAMLLGMGWTPQPKNKEVKAYEAQSRPIRLGLGATSKPWEKKRNDDSSRRIKPGEKRYKAGALVPGVTVGITSGPYRGDTGVVIEIIGTSVTVQLENLGRRADQPSLFVRVLDSEQGFRKFHLEYPLRNTKKRASINDHSNVSPPSKQSRITEEHPDASKRKSREKIIVPVGETSATESRKDARREQHGKKDKKHKYKKERHSHKPKHSERSSKKTRLWLHANTRVRIVNKKVEKGRFYKAKGIIIAVTNPHDCLCTIRITPGSKVLENVKQRYLETVLPPVEGEVLVVGGEYRGERGKLMQKSSRSEVAAIQLHDTLSVVKIHYDDVAEFCGRDEWL